MAEYRYFASVYDRMMDDIPYEEWKLYILMILYRYNVAPCSKIAELGCGTGIMTRRLAEEGFKITGIDISEDMLCVAKAAEGKEEKRIISDSLNEQVDRDIRYLCQDMREFSLSEKQAAVISICDSINYLLSHEDLCKTMSAVRQNLNEQGVFIFDLKTEHFFMNSLNGFTFKDDLGDFSYIWKNRYDAEKRIHEYRLLFRIKECDGGIRYEKELHRQRAFTAEEIKKAAMGAGFRKAVALDAFTFNKPRTCSDRIYIICKN